MVFVHVNIIHKISDLSKVLHSLLPFNVRTLRELCVSQLCPWQSLQGLLALTVLGLMHETSRQIVGRAGQSLSDGCQLAASLATLSSSSSMSSHRGRPRERALWSPIMIRGECAAAPG